jgi:hypothetical protein
MSLMVGVVLMLVAAIGIVLYVALVIAIPVCRMLDWFSGDPARERKSPADTPNIVRSTLGHLAGRRRSIRSAGDDDTWRESACKKRQA